VYGDAAWIALAKSAKFPPVEFAPEPPPPPLFVLKDDFELTPVGAKPSSAEVHVENKGDSIAVTEETAASGKRSLKITDAPGLQYTYNPHFCYKPNHKDCVSRCAFDMRLEPGVVMYHEWRDWREQPYRVGPSFTIRDAKLLVGGQELLALPVGQWFHVEVVAGIGSKSDGTWALILALPGQPPKRFDGLKNGHAEFHVLTWIGFSSTATDKTAFYLDNLEISNDDR
jgi:hypothetical protein